MRSTYEMTPVTGRSMSLFSHFGHFGQQLQTALDSTAPPGRVIRRFRRAFYQLKTSSCHQATRATNSRHECLDEFDLERIGEACKPGSAMIRGFAGEVSTVAQLVFSLATNRRKSAARFIKRLYQRTHIKDNRHYHFEFRQNSCASRVL